MEGLSPVITIRAAKAAKKMRTMIEKDPTTYSLLTYLWVFGLAAWGGVINFVQRIKTEQARPHNFMEFIGEIMTSAFAGLVTFYLCEAGGIDQLYTAVMVGITGHMGTRGIYLLEKMVQSRLGV